MADVRKWLTHILFSTALAMLLLPAWNVSRKLREAAAILKLYNLRKKHEDIISSLRHWQGYPPRFEPDTLMPFSFLMPIFLLLAIESAANWCIIWAICCHCPWLSIIRNKQLRVAMFLLSSLAISLCCIIVLPPGFITLTFCSVMIINLSQV